MSKKKVPKPMMFKDVETVDDTMKVLKEYTEQEDELKEKFTQQTLEKADASSALNLALQEQLKVANAIPKILQDEEKLSKGKIVNQTESKSIQQRARAKKKINEVEQDPMLKAFKDMQEEVKELRKQLGKKSEPVEEEEELPAIGSGFKKKATKEKVDNAKITAKDPAKSFNPYTVDSDGYFGKVKIDIPTLNKTMKLELYSHNGKRLLSRKIDYDFIELITKRFNPKKKGGYSDASIDAFNKLVSVSGLPKDSLSKKSLLLKRESSMPTMDKDISEDEDEIEIKTFNNPDDLVERLKDLLDEPATKKNHNEVSEILDKLVELGIITKDKRQKIYASYIE